ncbi:hypothetical protein [uncultured Sphingomonas sp.]|uniref:hypothetical protein n=1 Tax=uncultured Sphingomonas sp. TaxID=158754 RepID=UPI0025FD2170|nr:hypothetical protein [uncultured Sphingomonas sp.]
MTETAPHSTTLDVLPSAREADRRSRSVPNIDGKSPTRQQVNLLQIGTGEPLPSQDPVPGRTRSPVASAHFSAAACSAASSVTGGGLGGAPAGVCEIAALYVETEGCYFGLPGVDPWDVARDARDYLGPHPVVAHPPCQRWGKFWAGAPWKIARTGHRHQLGDDGGCFAAALNAVRVWGGILEHPEGSRAWNAFGLAKPQRGRGWVRADWPVHDGWTCCVEQGHYGHQARKPTWLYASGVDLPELSWGASIGTYLDEALHGADKVAHRRRMSAKYGICQMINTRDRLKTPVAFRDVLIGIARSAHARRIAA